MTFFQFLVLDMRLRGTRLKSIAEPLGVSVSYLGQVLGGHRPLSRSLRREASILFRVPQSCLEQLLNVREVQRLAKAGRKGASRGAAGHSGALVPEREH